MKSKAFERREFLRQAVGAAALLPLADCRILAGPWQQSADATQPPAIPKHGSFSEADDKFLEELERANFRYFWEQTNPDTGVIRDRCNATKPNGGDLGSIAATGFGLTALCIGDQRGYVTHTEAKTRIVNTLRFLWKKMPNHRGFFYHWANINTG